MESAVKGAGWAFSGGNGCPVAAGYGGIARHGIVVRLCRFCFLNFFKRYRNVQNVKKET
jgi:hypothetical protein